MASRSTSTRTGRVGRIRGDAEDVFSKGFLCPKGASLKALHDDPDRLRSPMIRQPDGSFAAATWDEAFNLIAERLPPLLAETRDAVAVYLGNPSVHSVGPMLYNRVLLKALGTRNVFSASTVDQMPKHVSSGHMFGAGFTIPIPDVDHTDYMLILGANPLVSNGSLLTAPDMRGRLRAIRERGGKVVVVDPRRTRTAEAADRHLAIRPGGDALLLMAMVHTLFAEDLVDGTCGGLPVNGVEEVRAAAADVTPERVEAACGIPADEIRTLARELAAAERAVVYGRIGTCTQAFGTQASWLVDVLNTLTGNLDRPGGAMWPNPAANATKRTRPIRFGRWASRVRGMPEVMAEFPVVCLSEEIETPGEGQVRAFITVAGNPVLSTPDGERLAAALDTLDFMISVDIYINETSRHADVILPPPSHLERSHYDLAFYGLAMRNVANYSAPLFEREPGMPDEWEVLLRLSAIAGGAGAAADLNGFDDLVVGEAIRREIANPDSRIAGRDAGELMEALAPRRGPDRLLDFLLRIGPYGDRFGEEPEGLTLSKLQEHPHGIDYGPMQPQIPDILVTDSKRVELAPEPFIADVDRLRAYADAEAAADSNGHLVLIGRRQLRSNNSWMHNLPLLVKGKEACTLHIHPDDVAKHGLEDGAQARVSTDRGSIELLVEATDAIRPGVVSIPHGWGHDAPGAQLEVAAAHAGANSNVLSSTTVVDPLSGNAVLCGIPVDVAPVRALSSV